MYTLVSALRFLAMAGNMLFFLWILYNGINENFAGTPIEKISYVVLMMLLLTNTVLLIRFESRKSLK